MRQSPAHRLTARARWTVLWTVVCLVGLQAAYHYPFSSWWPQLQDPEYGGLLARLRTQLAAKSAERPLALILGSSHTSMGLRPGLLEPPSVEYPSPPLVFNFSLNGSSYVCNLVWLNRLLAEGIHPDYLFVEAWPLHLSMEADLAKANGEVPVLRAQHQDIEVLQRYYANPHLLRSQWRESAWLPWYSHRQSLLNYLSAHWFPREQRLRFNWDHTDDWGWKRVSGFTEPTPAHVVGGQKLYTVLLSVFRISDEGDRALRELCQVCRREHIHLMLLRMPEAEYCRKLYPPACRQQVNDYFERVCREEQASMVNAEDWVPDDRFADGHHLTPAGAETFTRRFEREVLQHLGR